MSSEPTVILCHAGARPTAHGAKVWLYLGRDYRRYMEWKRELGSAIETQPLQSSLSDVSRRLREPFLRILASLGRDHDSIEWWTSRLAERNPMVSDLFLHCCYLVTAEEYASRKKGRLLIVAENVDLLKALQSRFSTSELTVVSVGVLRARLVERVLVPARMVKRVMSFLISGLIRKRLGSDLAPGVVILLKTWVDETCFDARGFRDRYFPGVLEFLTKRSLRVVVLPVLYNITRSAWSAWRWLNRQKVEFLNEHRYYRMSDYGAALAAAWRQRTLVLGRVEIENRDVTSLFVAELRRWAFDTVVLNAILSSHLPLRLSERGIRVAQLVDVFENMVSEKALLLGFRRFMPGTRLVAFQHGIPAPMLLSLFMSEEEASFAPLPDRVICNGPFFRELLVKGGLPEERVQSGTALRYAYLFDQKQEPTAGTSNEVLVPLPLADDEAIELLMKVHASFHNDNSHAVTIKPHPMSDVSQFLRAARLGSLPSHFRIDERPMSECLRSAGVLVGLGSSTLFEAFISGVPVVVVGRDNVIDLNPLAWFEEFAHPAYNAVDIRERVIARLAEGEARRKESVQRGRKLLYMCFQPVNDETLQTFVDPETRWGAA